MRRDTSSTKVNGDDGAWSEIEQLVAEAMDLARQPMSNRDFYVELLHRLMQAIGAESISAWTLQPDGQLRFEYRTASAGTPALDATPAMQALFSSVARQRSPRIVPPGASSSGTVENPTSNFLIAHPIEIDGRTVGVLEVQQSENASPKELQGVEELVGIFGDVAREFHRERQLRELLHREQAWTDLDSFAAEVHRTLDWRGTCYAVANEGVGVTGCDRVSVLTRGKTISVSGIDSVNRRSNSTRAMEALAKVVTRTGEPLWFPCDGDSLSPQIETKLERFHDQTHARSVAVIPLEKSPSSSHHRRRLDAIVFERFDGAPWTDAQQRRIDSVCRHAASAMQNASEFSTLPLLWVSRVAQALLWPLGLRQLPKTMLVIAAVLGAIAALCFVPGDFVIEGRGELQPATRRHLFAPMDAVIEKVHVDHSDRITAGQVLLELRHADLDFKMAGVLGDLQTQQKQFETVRARRLNHARLNSDDSTEFDDLTSEEEKLKTIIASLVEQKKILTRQVAELKMVSQIDGEVLTWGLAEQLKSRAVRRGERLLTVGETQGRWMLEMWIADHDVEHVLQAQGHATELPVSFVLASQSGEANQGQVERVGMTTETTADGRPGVRVIVVFDRTQLSELRPGTTAFAKIHCGRRPIGYIWFRELFEVVRTRVLF